MSADCLGVHGAGAGNTIEEQTEVALANIAAVLGVANLTMADVVKTTVHLQEVGRDAPGVEAVYRRVFIPPYPVRTTVGS